MNWPTWEQFCFWKIVSAHSVPIECYLPLLVSLDAKEHPEAITSILLNVQKIYEPNSHIIESVIAASGLGKEQYIASLLRHWALKTDVKELVKNILLIIDPPAAPVKRKGLVLLVSLCVFSTSTLCANRSDCLTSTSPCCKSNRQPKAPPRTLSPICIKTLATLELIRAKAPKNKSEYHLCLG